MRAICPDHTKCDKKLCLAETDNIPVKNPGEKISKHCFPHHPDENCIDGCGWNEHLNQGKPCIPLNGRLE